MRPWRTAALPIWQAATVAAQVHRRNSGTGAVRPLTQQDLDWVVDLARRRGERLVPYAPRFWNPAPAATETHRQFLASLIDAPDVLSARTRHGFLFGMPRGHAWLVDDMAIEPDDSWAVEGPTLLLEAGRNHRVRVVVPVFEAPRRTVAASLGLQVIEAWWHRDLDTVDPTERLDPESAIAVDRAEGRLVPAPPIYAPGGPVLLVTSVDSPAALGRIERAAAQRGAPVSVVSQHPADSGLRHLLEAAGYTLTTEFSETP